MERRQYQCKKQIGVAIKVQKEAFEEQHQTSGKTFVKSTLVQERKPTMIALPTSTHNIPFLESLYESFMFVKSMNPSKRT